MTKSLPLLVVAALMSSACAPKVYVRAMRAASVTIPPEIQRVAVVDRSKAKNVGETALGVLEGAVTGEVPLEDNRGREEAIRELVQVLEQSPRYEVVRPLLTPKQVDSSLFDAPWSHKSVVRLCEEHGCDAVIALETFDTDATVTSGALEVAAEPEPEATPEPAPSTGTPMVRKPDGTAAERPPAEAEAPAPEAEEDSEPPPMTHWAERRTRLSATWRMYDTRADTSLDEVRDRVIGSQSRKEGMSTEQAITKLASANALISADGRKLGKEYGVRISPTWVGLQRKYYAGGGQMKVAAHHVEAGDWDGAAAIWKQIVQGGGSAKTVGKARYNLALAAEVGGQLRKAHKLAQKAAIELHNGRSQSYAASLARRVEEQAKVEAQLAPPEEVE
ncbi:MAG: hypothetical protein KC912_16240 [Proteobacteria bacterium]|nr:hypothetical protein [Pseudomonadota bacterium]